MSMRKHILPAAPTTSMKINGLWLVLGFLLVLSLQFSLVHCRVLRSGASNEGISDGCEDVKGETVSLGMASFAVSSNNFNSITRPSVRSLAFRLASGPSKKGPGH
ncbi:Transmembrane protein [Quillaja saponaria]|uniref:Transmembrane protein n=1 Tax=Quillaja saponaria TaxID=32244 RepID=A0AAD7PK91_QUISA|nr:Transmembrane protein [Quillaja saponaria]